MYKNSSQNIFLLRIRTNYITNADSIVSLDISYLSLNIFCSNVSTNYFCTPFLEVKTDNTQKEDSLHILHNMYSCRVQTMSLAKKNNYNKMISEITSCYNDLLGFF